ncbi:phosphopantetheine-binding protein [Streptomyces venetus]|uniref:acyl carrier protein n=1 Tax=Streptomyces venetus TaxID=1701086 RepID=UPI003C2D321B
MDPDDDFFELGGDSLSAVRIGAALGSRGLPSPRRRELYRNPAVRATAASLVPPSRSSGPVWASVLGWERRPHGSVESRGPWPRPTLRMRRIVTRSAGAPPCAEGSASVLRRGSGPQRGEPPCPNPSTGASPSARPFPAAVRPDHIPTRPSRSSRSTQERRGFRSSRGLRRRHSSRVKGRRPPPRTRHWPSRRSAARSRPHTGSVTRWSTRRATSSAPCSASCTTRSSTRPCGHSSTRRTPMCEGCSQRAQRDPAPISSVPSAC